MTTATGVELRQTLARRPPWLPRTLNRLTAPRSAPDRVLRAHRWLYEHSDGRIGQLMIGAPTLLLWTTGRRTGIRRCSAVSYAVDRDGLIIAASNSGADHPPAWFHNLRSNSAVHFQIGRHHLSGTAAVVESTDPDYKRLWGLMNTTNNRRYDAYQTLTSRPIALVAISIEEA